MASSSSNRETLAARFPPLSPTQSAMDPSPFFSEFEPTQAEDAAFEAALAAVDGPSVIHLMKEMLPNESPLQIMSRYFALLGDDQFINASYVTEPPDCIRNEHSTGHAEINVVDEECASSGTPPPPPPPPPAEVVEVAEEAPARVERRRGKLKRAVEKRAKPGPPQGSRRGKSWTPDEHRMFLAGLEVHGRGAWTLISKNFVQTRTPSQVASHAQKYFTWLCKSKNKEKIMNEMGSRTSAIDIMTIAGAMKPPAGEPSMPNVVGNELPWAIINDIAYNGMGGATDAQQYFPTLPPTQDYVPLLCQQQTIPEAPVESGAWPGLGPAPYIFNVPQLEAWMQQDFFFDKNQNGKS